MITGIIAIKIVTSFGTLICIPSIITRTPWHTPRILKIIVNYLRIEDKWVLFFRKNYPSDPEEYKLFAK